MQFVFDTPKSGTTHFHGYDTVSIVRDNRRYVIALHFIEYGEEMADIVRWLIKYLKMLRIRIQRVFWDKGFCSKPVFKVWLSLRRLALWLSRAIDCLWGSTEVIQHQPRLMLS